MSSLAAPLFTKDDAVVWFRSAIESLELGSQSFTRAWEPAWHAFEDQGAHPERWKGWVRMLVQRALSKAKTDPGGLFITLLGDPPSDLDKAPKPSANLADHREIEGQRYLERVRREAEDYRERYGDAKPPSLVACTHLVGLGGNPRSLHKAWEDQGRPPEDQIDFPLWPEALERARRGTAFGGRRRA